MEIKRLPIALAWEEAKTLISPHRCFGEVFWPLLQRAAQDGRSGAELGTEEPRVSPGRRWRDDASEGGREEPV